MVSMSSRNFFKWLMLLLAAIQLPDLACASPVFERPIPDGGGTTSVRCAVAILDVDEISDASQNFTVNVYALFEWNRSRHHYRTGAERSGHGCAEVGPHVSDRVSRRPGGSGHICLGVALTIDDVDVRVRLEY